LLAAVVNRDVGDHLKANAHATEGMETQIAMTREIEIEGKMIAELQANAWLQRQLLSRLKEREVAIGIELRQELAKDGAQLADIENRISERLNDYEGLIRGRLMRPVLRHLYMLAYVPRSDADLKRWAEQASYELRLLQYHYDRREFPQAFLRDWLAPTMKGDISKASADKILVLLVRLGFLDRRDYLKPRPYVVLSFSQELKNMIEHWVELKSQSTEAPQRAAPIGPNGSARRQPPAALALLFIAALAAGWFLSAESTYRDQPPSTRLADAVSELDAWRPKSPILVVDAESELSAWKRG